MESKPKESWPIDGRISKAVRKNYVWPEKPDRKKSIDDKNKNESDASNAENFNEAKNEMHDSDKQPIVNEKDDKNTYHVFRRSCGGYKPSRRCPCLNKFIRMPLWLLILLGIIILLAFLLLALIFGLILGLKCSNSNNNSNSQSSTGVTAIPTSQTGQPTLTGQTSQTTITSQTGQTTLTFSNSASLSSTFGSTIPTPKPCQNEATYDYVTQTCTCLYSTYGDLCENLKLCADILQPDPIECSLIIQPDYLRCPITFRCNGTTINPVTSTPTTQLSTVSTTSIICMNFGTVDPATNTCKCYNSTSGAHCENLLSCALIKIKYPIDPASCANFQTPTNFANIYCPNKFRCSLIG